MTREDEMARKHARAIAMLREGCNGLEQTRNVRVALRDLERAGLARYDRDTWHLTDEARASLEAKL